MQFNTKEWKFNIMLLLLYVEMCSSSMIYQHNHLIFRANDRHSFHHKNIIIQELMTKRHLKELLNRIVDHLVSYDGVKCIAIVCDTIYLNIFEGDWYKGLQNFSYFMVIVKESEDLLSPNFDTLESIRQIRRDGCKAYIILIANGIQATRLLKFGDRYRVIDTRARFVILHDPRLFTSDLHYIWKRIVNVIFIRHFQQNGNSKNQSSWFELSTVPFPSPIREVLVTKRIQTWRTNEIFKPALLFTDKTLDLKGHTLQVVAFQHVPAVVKSQRMRDKAGHKLFSGMEIEIMQAFASIMNFKPRVYEPQNAKEEQWGHKQLNGSFSGLFGEMVEGKADIALGNLHYTPYHLQLTDLTIPYISECLTFLTPESLEDNSWMTLILPFKLNMWIAVLLVLLMSGFIFYSLAKFHKHINEDNEMKKDEAKKIMLKNELEAAKDKKIKRQTGFKTIRKPIKPEGLYLFEELTNSIMYTYGMLLVVSLPKLPPGWSIRLLTGWYWLYCVLVVVAYRASMTAILANPAPRVTIDTLQELAESTISCGGWGDQTREFFITALDETGQEIGNKFETVNDAKKAVRRITKGELAYYDNIHFLKYLRAKQQDKKDKEDTMTTTDKEQARNNSTQSDDSTGDRKLHVMRDCAIHMPISIGLQKNSPLKPRTDKLLRKIVEAGLVNKWLNDVMFPIFSVMSSEEESVKALMNLKKLYAGFVALAVGFSLGSIILLGEVIHWKYVVKRDPNFDIYTMDLYYAQAKAK